jgi:hypothetical protein
VIDGALWQELGSNKNSWEKSFQARRIVQGRGCGAHLDVEIRESEAMP